MRLVDVTGWARDAEHPVFPVGSKPKRLLRCPDHEPTPLVAGHSYLFKIADGWRRMQTWSEVIAYEIGASLGLEVPHCYLGINTDNSELGALVEFFYGYPDDPTPPRLIHASDLISRQTTATGRPHSVRLNMAVCRLLGVNDPVLWWARVFAFDALIGNTDRHLENWGVLTLRSPDGARRNWLAPVFDNGTSLGYELSEPNIEKMLHNTSQMDEYILRGRHHCSWDLAGIGDLHVALCGRLANAFPEARAPMSDVLAVDLDGFRTTLLRWCGLEVALPLSPLRVDFIVGLLSRRRTLLQEAIESARL